MQIDEQYHKQPLNQPELFTVDVQIREKKSKLRQKINKKISKEIVHEAAIQNYLTTLLKIWYHTLKSWTAYLASTAPLENPELLLKNTVERILENRCDNSHWKTELSKQQKVGTFRWRKLNVADFVPLRILTDFVPFLTDFVLFLTDFVPHWFHPILNRFRPIFDRFCPRLREIITMLYTKLSANRYNQFGDSSFGAVTANMYGTWFFEEVSIFVVWLGRFAPFAK